MSENKLPVKNNKQTKQANKKKKGRPEVDYLQASFHGTARKKGHRAARSHSDQETAVSPQETKHLCFLNRFIYLFIYFKERPRAF